MAKRSKKKKAVTRIRPEKIAEPVDAAKPVDKPQPWLNQDFFWGAALFLAVVLVYLPAWHAGYLWDDDIVITNNPVIVGPWGLREIWTTGAADICPLTLTTFWTEHALWGVAPRPYHVVNVLMHAAVGVLLWQVLRSLQIPGAWLGAALWALNPVQVESVEWVSEMKNTQSGIFFLLAILFFVRALKRDLGWNYGLSLLFSFLAIASKASTVVLPVALILGAWWVERRWSWRSVRRTAPVFIMALASGLISIWTQQLGGAKNPLWMRSWPERIAEAGDSVWFYLGKALWPHPLLVIYPRWHADASDWFSYLPTVTVVLVALLLWSRRTSWGRPYFFTWIYFVVALLPVLGFADMTFFRNSYVADHFQYLASMTPLALVGAGLSRLSGFSGTREFRFVPVTIGGALLLILAALTFQRAVVFKNEKNLWTDELVKNPTNATAHNNIGETFYQKGDLDAAMAEYHRAFELNPNNAETQNNYGVTLYRKGQTEEAIAHLRRAIELLPTYPDALNNLGIALQEQGHNDEALVAYEKAVKLRPDFINARKNLAGAHNNIALSLMRENKSDEAIKEYLAALTVDADLAEPHNNLANALLLKDRLDEAMSEYTKALAINPRYQQALTNLARIQAHQGHFDDAISNYEKALVVDPGVIDAHLGLGAALMHKNQPEAAAAEYRKAIELNPRLVGAHNSLGYVFFQSGHPAEALAEYQKALAIDPNDAETHNNLGIALARNGQFANAIHEFKEALRVQPNYVTAQKNLVQAQALAAQKK